MFTLDHLVITATDLDTGTAWAEDALGMPFGPGGQHLDMGTHNRLLGLGDIYIEVIAIEPGGTDPGIPRWFNLDALDGPPRLSHWACRTDDLPAAVARNPDIGIPKSLSRAHLRWRFAIPPTGRLPFDDLHPAVLSWDTDPPKLPHSGVTLTRLSVSHPDDLSGSVKISDPRVAFTQGPRSITAQFDTPNGPRTL